MAYLGPNSIDTFVCFFATARLGGVFVSLNTRLAAPEIGYMLAGQRQRACSCTGPSAPSWRTPPTPAPTGSSTSSPSRTSGRRRRRVSDARSPWPDHLVDLDDPALILYTSGTTGRPKGAVLTHGNITWNTVNQLAHVDVLSSDVALCVAPLFHVTGLGQVSMPTLLKGGTVVVVPKFDAGALPRPHRAPQRHVVLGRADDAADDVRPPRLGRSGPVVPALRALRRVARWSSGSRRPGSTAAWCCSRATA